MRNFREYDIYIKAINFSNTIYRLCNGFPKEERYALTDQILRATVSIPSNIAEGAGRPTDADFAHFLDQALGSANEVETQLLISKNLNYITEENYQTLILKLTSIQKQLTGLIANIRQQSGSR